MVPNFPPPPLEFVRKFPSPIKQDSSSTRKKNKTLSGYAAKFSVASTEAKQGNRKKEGARGRGCGGTRPDLHAIQVADLASADRVLELYQQAVAQGLVSDCLAWKQTFFAMANRARTRGRNAGGLLIWLVKKRKHEYVTLADEEAARDQLRALEPGAGRGRKAVPPSQPETMAQWVETLHELLEISGSEGGLSVTS